MPIIHIHNQVCTELEKNILSFWQNFACDNEFGGYIGQMSLAGEVDRKANKSAILTARILWAFSAAYQYRENDEYLAHARRAYCFLTEHLFDKECKGVYQTLAYDNSVINAEKNIISQAYAIYGLSAYYKASRDINALNYAYSIAELIEVHAFDKKSDSYAMLCTQQWVIINEKENCRYAQVHLHLIEAYTELLSCQYDQKIALALTKLIELFINFMIDKQDLHIGQKYSQDWTLISARQIYGHDLEAAWLLVSAAEQLNNSALVERCSVFALKLIDKVIAVHSCAGVDGSSQIFDQGFKLGINFEDDINNNREGWIQAEAISALSWAYSFTGNENYRHWLVGTWDYIQREIKDHHNGEWFSGRNDDGSLVAEQVKIGPWKCPYHSVRACIKFIQLLESPIGNK